jgi:hypothetical protein
MRTEGYSLLAENKTARSKLWPEGVFFLKKKIDDSNGITASKQFISEGSQNKKPASIFGTLFGARKN